MPAIGFDEALRIILSSVQPVSSENVALDKALGRIAAAAVIADEDAVPFPRSAMDGYAVRASECARATKNHPIELPVAGNVFAEKGESILAPGTALAIMTGAPVPRGADAVIPHERTEQHGASVHIFAPVAPGDCVFPPGEDFRKGDELIATGEVLNAGKLALLAFAGKPAVRVFRRPRVAIVCTGDELVDPASTPTHGQVRKNEHELYGANSRLDELHAAMLRVKLKQLDARNRRRAAIAAYYSEHLGQLVIPPLADPTRTHVYHQYVVRTPARDALRAHLVARGIETGVHYPVPIHRQPAWLRAYGETPPLPRAEQAAREMLSLPVHADLTDEEVERVADGVVQFFERR